MNLKSIRDAITSKAGMQILKTRKHSPALLFGAGIVGVVATAVLASKATLKLTDILEDAEYDLEKIKTTQSVKYSEEDRQHDTILVYLKTGTKVARLYAPAVAVGALSIAALTGSHVILTRRNIAVTAAYAAVDKAFRQYRERVMKALGKDQDDQFRYGFEEREIVEETDKGPQTKLIKRVGAGGESMYARYFDNGSPNWSPQPGYNAMFLKCQMGFANDQLRSNGYIFLNDVYKMLGIKPTPEGQVVGWLRNGSGDGYVDFGIFDAENAGWRDFINGWNKSVLLDFNVDGVIYEKI